MFYRGNVQRRKLLKPRSHKKKKTAVNQPEWDNTVQDLTVHAASPEEVLRRQIRHRSKNADIARREIASKKRGIPVDMMLSPGQVELEMKKLAVLREVLYDHNDLNAVLKKTDQTMASVKNIFHDSALRKSGYPNVTLAPGKKQAPPIQSFAGQPSRLDVLSDSVMDSQALNDQVSSENESEYDDDVQFESKVDYDRFMTLLKDSMNNTRFPSNLDTLATTPEKDESTCAKAQGALNCTEEVKRTLSRISSIKEAEDEDKAKKEHTRKIDKVISGLAKDTSKLERKLNNSVANRVVPLRPMPNHTQCNLSYDDLQGAMENVEKNLTEFEKRTGRIRKEEKVSSNCGLAGFTVTLIDSVTRLTTYVNEGEVRTQELEKTIQDLGDKLGHQVKVNEALALELVNTQKVIKQDQDEMASLKQELKNERESKEKAWDEQREKLERDVLSLSKAVGDLENKIVISEHTFVDEAATSDDNLGDIQLIEGNYQKTGNLVNNTSLKEEIRKKEEEEEALKSDMVRLLSALKSQNNKVVTSQNTQASSLPTSMTAMTDGTQEAAKTIATVESHLRHLQLQHAEAQQRMDELTKHAQMYPQASGQQMPSSGNHSPSSFATDSSMAPLPSRIIPQRLEQRDPFPSSLTSGANNNPASLPIHRLPNRANAQPIQTNLISTSAGMYYTSPPTQDNFVPSKELPRHDFGGEFGSDAGSFKFLEEDSSETDANISLASSNATPVVAEQQQAVLNSIQRTQTSLEDRISELNKQHSQAQERLQKLVARRKKDQQEKKVQISVPTAEMFATPQVSFKPSLPIPESFSTEWFSMSPSLE